MLGTVIIAMFVILLALVLLARFTRNPTQERGERAQREQVGQPPFERITPIALRDLFVELLERLGLHVVEDMPAGAARRRIVAVHPGALGTTRYLVVLDAAPLGGIVEQTAALELADEVRARPGSLGVLVTPYAIDREGLAAIDEVMLVDGSKLRELFAEHLPHKLAELERYELAGPLLEPPLDPAHAP